MSRKRTVGVCSLCGGRVTLPEVWWSVVDPEPTCSRCGAVAAPTGPVIPMVQPTREPTRCWISSGHDESLRAR